MILTHGGIKFNRGKKRRFTNVAKGGASKEINMHEKKIIKVNLENKEHCEKIISLLNDYMRDEMGMGSPMSEALPQKIIEGLKKHSAYLGFFVLIGNEYAALANCNLNFSTWQAKPLINIHDFIVSPKFRQQGIGVFLLSEIEDYARHKGCCKVNLEVRNDNIKAQGLYEKAGFSDCLPPMYFWQKLILQ